MRQAMESDTVRACRSNGSYRPPAPFPTRPAIADPAHAMLGTPSILVAQRWGTAIMSWTDFHVRALAARHALQANHGSSNRQDYPDFDRRRRHSKHRLLCPVSLERRKVSARAKGAAQGPPPDPCLH